MILLLLLFTLFASTSYASFPRGSCPTQKCSLSPYEFVWSSVTNGSFCFKVVPSASCTGPCCPIFNNLFMKFVINTQTNCSQYFQQVNINGIKKPGGVFFDKFGLNNSESELRVTSMTYNNETISNVTFCIITNKPCNTLETFCNGPCQYSIYEPYKHQCCPTCYFTPQTANSPPLWTNPPWIPFEPDFPISSPPLPISSPSPPLPRSPSPPKQARSPRQSPPWYPFEPDYPPPPPPPPPLPSSPSPPSPSTLPPSPPPNLPPFIFNIPPGNPSTTSFQCNCTCIEA